MTAGTDEGAPQPEPANANGGAQHLPAYLLFRVLSTVFSLFPEFLARSTGRALGWIGFHLRAEKRELLERHMRRVLGPGADTRKAARGMFMQYGRYWAEVFWVTPRRKREIVEHCDVIDLSYAEEALERGRGAIFALPHMGNWEAAGAKAEAIDMQVLAVAEALPNPRLIDWFVDIRNQMGIDIVVARKGERITPKLVARLREGRIVALLADRDLKGNGIDVEFFGERTTMPAGPAALAERTGAALLPVGAYFRKGRGHTLEVEPPIPVPDLDTKEARVAWMTQELADAFEVLIRKAPEQWHLFQPNWPSDRESS